MDPVTETDAELSEAALHVGKAAAEFACAGEEKDFYTRVRIARHIALAHDHLEAARRELCGAGLARAA